MDWLTVLLILGLVVVILVAVVGGRGVVSARGLEFDSEGLIRLLQKASESKGVDPSPATPLREEGSSFVQRTRNIDRTLPLATILWVDDDPLNNLFERRAFATLGIFCDSYATNADAMAALQAGDYDVVVSDIGRGDLPETGWDTLDEVRSKQPEIPFVFYTINVDESLRERAAARGGSAVEELPDKLVGTVLELLPKRR